MNALETVKLAARYSCEMHTTAMQNDYISAVDKILSRSPKYNPYRSCFRYCYGELRGFINGSKRVPPYFFLCFGN